MKYLKKLIILFILFLPILVNAKLNEIELENQFNTGYSSLYYYKDFFFTNYKDLINKEDKIKTFDLEGNEISSLKINKKDNYTISEDYIYYLDNTDNTISKLELKTFKEVKKINISSTYDSIYISSNNIVVNNDDYKYEVYNKELKKLTSFSLSNYYTPIIGDDYYIIRTYANSIYTYTTYDFNNKQQGTYQTSLDSDEQSSDGKSHFLYRWYEQNLVKINPNTLKVEKEIITPIEIDNMNIINDKVYITDYNKYYYSDINLNEFTVITEDEYEKEFYNYYNEVREDSISEEEYQKFISYIFKELNISNDELFIDYAIESNNQYYTITEKEGNILSIVYTDKEFTELKIMNIKNDEIKINRPFGNADIYANKNGISVLISTISNCPVSIIQYDCSPNVIFQTYTPIYNIETKTDGNGTIKVLSTAKSGEGITFEITPKEGYVLGVVKVTDKDGNVLTFTDYKFTMPSSDVTIEATFLPENPETSDLITYIILLFGLTTLFIIYIKNEQKRKYYKNIK